LTFVFKIVLQEFTVLPESPSQNSAAAVTGTLREGRLPAPRCASQDLLTDGRLYIEHQGELYCLQQTKAGRLLLTK
jgi:hemin uptake protein HemP